ncbi:hypothetical protein B0J18DRAFT_491123 [Chaetomium sp. MPI-SDFR-AT-0129]|nr:hypothetical protein B0J18DRAFT_491123 [Chaetomium sp. MPI-SDFR-AT-0129]
MHGKYESLKALHAVSPCIAPEAHGWGKYDGSDIYSMLSEFRKVGEQPSSQAKFTKRFAEMHKKSQFPTGKFGFNTSDTTTWWNRYRLAGAVKENMTTLCKKFFPNELAALQNDLLTFTLSLQQQQQRYATRHRHRVAKYLKHQGQFESGQQEEDDEDEDEGEEEPKYTFSLDPYHRLDGNGGSGDDDVLNDSAS